MSIITRTSTTKRFASYSINPDSKAFKRNEAEMERNWEKLEPKVRTGDFVSTSSDPTQRYRGEQICTQ